MHQAASGAELLVHADMAEQPAVLERLLGRRAELGEVLARFRSRPPRGVLLVARGSSDNAATYGRYVLEAATGRPVTLAANSLWTRYERAARLPDWLVVAISQSGATPEVVEVMRLAGESGSFTLAVTNDLHSELAAGADAVFSLGAGPERAIPATKTYTATLVALALVAETLGDPPWSRGALDDLPGAVASALDRLDGLDRATELLARGEPSVHLGRGFLYGAALESALKMREIARVVADGYALGDFLHGPIAATGEGTQAVCHIGGGATRDDGYQVVAAVTARGVTTVVIASDDRGPALTARVSVPPVEETLAAVLHAVAGQRLALQCALARGVDPDHPLGLHKVTATT